jgi:hypothetical protein
MATINRGALFVVFMCAGLLALSAQGCATSGPPVPAGPVELDGTNWKLSVVDGRFDGRVVSFKKKGKDGYIGSLADKGQRLRDAVGIEIGREIFAVRRKAENEYEGMYKAVGSDGSISENEVRLFVNGNTMSWNLQSAQWERIQ